MPAYDLSSPGAVSASAEQARIRAGQEPDQNSYNAAWLHGYASALANVAKAVMIMFPPSGTRNRRL